MTRFWMMVCPKLDARASKKINGDTGDPKELKKEKHEEFDSSRSRSLRHFKRKKYQNLSAS